MSHNSKPTRKAKHTFSQAKAAIRYVQKQLAVMDGDFERALRRIGWEGYRAVVREVIKGLPTRRRGR